MPQKNRTDYNLYHRSYQLAFFLRKKKEAIEYLGGKCIRCGYDKCHGALHFHHRDPTTKLGAWDKVRLWSKERRLKELDKCDLLCANCHAEIHDELHREKVEGQTGFEPVTLELKVPHSTN